jgi:hypothetical protein
MRRSRNDILKSTHPRLRPAGGEADVQVIEIYVVDHAKKVIRAAQSDYDETYGG